MDAKGRNSDFREADRKYDELARKREAGSISDEEFDAERKRLMVLDKQGQWWAKSAKSGEWKYYDGNGWVPGLPPGYEPREGEASAEAEAGSEPESGQRAGGDGAAHSDGRAREVDGEEGRRSSLRRPILVAALLLVVLLVGGGYMLSRSMTLTSSTGGMGGTSGTVAVPDIVGASSVEEARDSVGGDFEVVESGRVESEEPIGAVVAQEPFSSEQAAGDSTISVDVSKGVAVPDVEGGARDEAVQTLEGAGFEVDEKSKESSEGDDGKVTDQSPGGGKYAEAGSAVRVTVGEGPDNPDTGGGVAATPDPAPAPAPDARIPVPDVIGESVGEAEQTLEDAGFSTDIETVQSGESAGTVVSTDPDPGTLLDPASGEVVIGSSSGPPESPPESPPDDQYVPPDEGS